jgi:amino acid permease
MKAMLLVLLHILSSLQRHQRHVSSAYVEIALEMQILVEMVTQALTHQLCSHELSFDISVSDLIEQRSVVS